MSLTNLVNDEARIRRQDEQTLRRKVSPFIETRTAGGVVIENDATVVSSTIDPALGNKLREVTTKVADRKTPASMACVRLRPSHPMTVDTASGA